MEVTLRLFGHEPPFHSDRNGSCLRMGPDRSWRSSKALQWPRWLLYDQGSLKDIICNHLKHLAFSVFQHKVGKISHLPVAMFDRCFFIRIPDLLSLNPSKLVQWDLIDYPWGSKEIHRWLRWLDPFSSAAGLDRSKRGPHSSPPRVWLAGATTRVSIFIDPSRKKNKSGRTKTLSP